MVESLDEELKTVNGEGGTRTKMDLVASKDPLPDQIIDIMDARMLIDEILKHLSPFQKEVFRLRFVENWTLQKIGNKYYRSRERIRQHETEIIRISKRVRKEWYER